MVILFPIHFLERTMSRTQTAKKPYPPFRSGVVHALLILAAIGGVFLAGTIRQGSSGIFLAVAGAAMILLPPNRAVPWKYWLVCGVMLGCASLSLLPHNLWPMPEWRVGLQDYQGLPPLPHITLVPRETAYWLMMLGAAMLIGLYSLGHPVRSGAKILLAALGSVLCSGYACVAIYSKWTGWQYPFFDADGWSPADFGFFPNRNHTAALLVSGAVLGFGVVRAAWSRSQPIVFFLGVASLTVCSYALLFESSSRGGVVFLIVGAVLWLAAMGRSHLTLPLVVSALIVAGFLVYLFLSSGGGARDRLLDSLGFKADEAVAESATGGEELGRFTTAMSDFRMRIIRDTLRMVRDYPITGTGLGTYEYVYPFYSKESIGEATAVHPESDWVMAAAESGVPFLLCGLYLFWLLVRDTLSLKESASWPLRWGLASVALVAFLHGMVDVPVHRIELGWWILVIAGLAFGIPLSPKDGRCPSRMTQQLCFGIAGAAVLALGIMLIRSQWFGGPQFPPYRDAVAVDQMRQLVEVGRLDEATNLARSEIPLSPMSRGLYRELGYREIRNEGNPIVADTVFAVERALNPVSAQIPLDQGRLWLGDDTTRTAKLWGEALAKNLKIARGGGYARPVELYESLLSQSHSYHGLTDALGEFASLSPEFRLVWISRGPKGSVSAAVEDKGFLSSLDVQGRRRFLMAWWLKDDKDALEQFLQSNPSWEPEAWPVRVQQMLSRKEYEFAVKAVLARYGIELSLPSVDATGPEPRELPARVAYYLAKRNPVSAERIVSESAMAKESEGFRLQCALAVAVNDWASAWKALEGYLRAEKKQDQP